MLCAEVCQCSMLLAPECQTTQYSKKQETKSMNDSKLFQANFKQ